METLTRGQLPPPYPVEWMAPPEPRKGDKRSGRKWRQSLRVVQPAFNGRRIDQFEHDIVTDRYGLKPGLANMYWGGSAFLLLCGPSVLNLDLSKLQMRGCVTMAINNAATVARPQLWTCGDPPIKFHSAIWRDPGIMKFVPRAKKWNPIRAMADDGEIRDSGELAWYQPNVFTYERNTYMRPDQFLTESTINFGNSAKHNNGLPVVLSTMFSALRILHFLGFFNVFLLGCDFYMSGAKTYCHDDQKPSGAVETNNSSYVSISKLLGLLKPEFDRAGFSVFNCNPRSLLTVFPHISYDDAIWHCTHRIDQEPSSTGWDDKSTR